MFFSKKSAQSPKKSKQDDTNKRQKVDLNDYILDDKLYNFAQQMKEKLKDKNEITKLTLQFEKLVKIDEEQRKKANQNLDLSKKR